MSFDLGLVERFGCEVIAFDPTPRAIAFAEPIAAREPRFRFMPVGLWSEDTTLRFYRPTDPAHVSHSAVNLQRTTSGSRVRSGRLDTLMAELGDTSIDLLKLDIEGAEHTVLATMLEAGVRPGVVCFEVDRPVSAVSGSGKPFGACDATATSWSPWTAGTSRSSVAGSCPRSRAARPRMRRTSPGSPSGSSSSTASRSPRYILRSLYPFAHEIIVVEGAAPGASNIATPDGHSRDGTLAELRRFKAEEDPDGKVTIVTAEDEGHPYGFWPGEKDEQSRAYAKRATGNYLWQVDIDEFYRAEEMARVLDMLRGDPTIDGADLQADHVLGRSPLPGRRLVPAAGRRPTTTGSSDGAPATATRPIARRPCWTRDGRDLRDGQLAARPGPRTAGHSPLPLLAAAAQAGHRQVRLLRQRRTGRSARRSWPGLNDAFLRLGRPYHVHNVYEYPSWLERYEGPHPVEAVRLVDDLARSHPGRRCARRRTSNGSWERGGTGSAEAR